VLLLGCREVAAGPGRGFEEAGDESVRAALSVGEDDRRRPAPVAVFNHNSLQKR